MIFRSKVYSEYLKRWLSALHRKLKNKRCNQLAKRLQLRFTARSFVKWRNVFLWK